MSEVWMHRILLGVFLALIGVLGIAVLWWRGRTREGVVGVDPAASKEGESDEV